MKQSYRKDDVIALYEKYYERQKRAYDKAVEQYNLDKAKWDEEEPARLAEAEKKRLEKEELNRAIDERNKKAVEEWEKNRSKWRRRREPDPIHYYDFGTYSDYDSYFARYLERGPQEPFKNNYPQLELQITGLKSSLSKVVILEADDYAKLKANAETPEDSPLPYVFDNASQVRLDTLSSFWRGYY